MESLFIVKGYVEWISKDGVGFIVNPFGRLLYINPNWPESGYEKVEGNSMHILKRLRKRCTQGRSFTKEELMLELL